MVYVSSDWHGCPLETVRTLLQKANFGADDFLFILGDVIDRGAHGVELLKFLMVQPNMELLMGNHEVFLLANAWLLDEVNEENLSKFGADRLNALRVWRRNGGDATLDALRRESPESRAEILEFVRDCPVYDSVSVGERDFFLVHGGLGGYSPDKRIGEYEEDDLLWERPAITDRYSTDFTTVIGHTPTHFYGPEHKGRILHTETWIDVDTGAAGGLPPCLLRLDDMKEFYL